MSPAETELHEKVLASAGIFECVDCFGTGRATYKALRNYTTRAQYEEDIEYPCPNCDGIGTLPVHRFRLTQPELKVWDNPWKNA